LRRYKVQYNSELAGFRLELELAFGEAESPRQSLQRDKIEFVILDMYRYISLSFQGVNGESRAERSSRRARGSSARTRTSNGRDETTRQGLSIGL
jgi:hypothetical protein